MKSIETPCFEIVLKTLLKRVKTHFCVFYVWAMKQYRNKIGLPGAYKGDFTIKAEFALDFAQTIAQAEQYKKKAP